MADSSGSDDLVVRPTYDTQLANFEHGLQGFLDNLGLPAQDILVPVTERQIVIRNIQDVVARLPEDKRQQSTYISKFIAAVGVGLFDAALNYLWDETIYELRLRVAHYDVAYFYDNAVLNPEKRKKLKNEEDLVYLDDSELIGGAREIGLISEIGFKHLDYIRYMRNWASAAHPNQNQLTGLNLISWLETCILQVISLPIDTIVVGIKRLLANVKANTISDIEARSIGTFFLDLPQPQVNTLANGFFGIYTRTDTTPQTIQNIHRLLPMLWERVDEATRQGFGLKHARFVANNDQQEAGLAHQFLEVVSALSYMIPNLLAAEIASAIENLLTAHRGFNNFYNEPAFARALDRLVGQVGRIPQQVNKSYVLGVVEVFLTNGNGVAHSANPIYQSLIDRFDHTQALLAVLSFTEEHIASRLQFSLCQQKYREFLELMKVKVSAPAAKEIIEDIEGFPGPLDKMKDDSRIKRRVANLQKIIG